MKIGIFVNDEPVYLNECESWDSRESIDAETGLTFTFTALVPSQGEKPLGDEVVGQYERTDGQLSTVVL